MTAKHPDVEKQNVSNIITAEVFQFKKKYYTYINLNLSKPQLKIPEGDPIHNPARFLGGMRVSCLPAAMHFDPPKHFLTGLGNVNFYLKIFNKRLITGVGGGTFFSFNFRFNVLKTVKC